MTRFSKRDKSWTKSIEKRYNKNLKKEIFKVIENDTSNIELVKLYYFEIEVTVKVTEEVTEECNVK